MIRAINIQGMTFRIMKGRYGGHGKGVKRNDAILFGELRIGACAFKNIEVPVDLYSVLKEGAEIEIFTTLAGGIQVLVAVNPGGGIVTSRKYVSIDREHTGLISNASALAIAGGIYGLYATSSYGVHSSAGIVTFVFVIVMATMALMLSLWYSSTANDIEKAIKVLSV